MTTANVIIGVATLVLVYPTLRGLFCGGSDIAKHIQEFLLALYLEVIILMVSTFIIVEICWLIGGL